jgi:hypothetical protein
MIRLLVGMLCLLAGPAWAQDGYDLSDLLECRVGQGEYGMMASAIAADPNTAADYGLKAVPLANPLLLEFETNAPIAAFGMETSRVAFASSGLLGLFQGADVRELASKFGVTATVDSGEKFLGEKMVSETMEDDADLKMRFRTRIALNISTVDTHPGIVLAGCTYSVTTEDLP